MKRGETVSSIAGEEYGDPALWRVIADHNDLDDPFRPRAGDGAAAASRDGVPVGKVARVTTRQGFDVAVPEVKLRVNGNDLSLDATSDIISVHVLEDVNAAGMFTLTVLNWDNKEMRVTWIDDDEFKEVTRSRSTWRYRKNMKNLFKGEITGMEP